MMRMTFWVLLLSLGLCQGIFLFKLKKSEPSQCSRKQAHPEANKKPGITENEANDTAVVASAEIDQNGGIVTVEKPGSPIDGLIVDIPTGAFDRKAVVSVSIILGIVPVRAGRNCGFTVVLTTQGIKSFHKHVSIIMPYDPLPQNRLVIPYEIDDENRLHIMDIGRLDSKNRKLVIYTFKPVRFTLVYPKRK